MNTAADLFGVVNLILFFYLIYSHWDELRFRERLIDRLREDANAAHLKWTAVLNQISESHAEELRRFATMRTAGVPKIEEAVVIPSKDDPEQRVARMVREQTIEAGMQSIMDNYREAGQSITEEDARRQAVNILAGRSPV